MSDKENPKDKAKNTQFDIIRNIVHEAKSYQKFEDIEKLVEIGSSLVNIPVQPLYIWRFIPLELIRLLIYCLSYQQLKDK